MDAARNKKTIFVGGLPEYADEASLASRFAPFGDIVDVQIPRDHGKHRGFGFVAFSTAEEAHDAIDNMHLNHIDGRIINVNIAKPSKTATGASNRPVWQDEEWLKQYGTGEEKGAVAAAGEAAEAEEQ